MGGAHCGAPPGTEKPAWQNPLRAHTHTLGSKSRGSPPRCLLPRKPDHDRTAEGSFRPGGEGTAGKTGGNGRSRTRRRGCCERGEVQEGEPGIGEGGRRCRKEVGKGAGGGTTPRGGTEAESERDRSDVAARGSRQPRRALKFALTAVGQQRSAPGPLQPAIARPPCLPAFPGPGRATQLPCCPGAGAGALLLLLLRGEAEAAARRAPIPAAAPGEGPVLLLLLLAGDAAGLAAERAGCFSPWGWRGPAGQLLPFPPRSGYRGVPAAGAAALYASCLPGSASRARNCLPRRPG